jgi:hypothetical protein
MKRFEYDILCRVIVNAESQEEADRLVGRFDYEVGRIVRENPWFELPGEQLFRMKSEDRPVMKTMGTPPVGDVQSDIDKYQAVQLLSRLWKHMERKGLSLSAVAKKLHTTTSTLTGWKSGKWKPSEKSQERIIKWCIEEESKTKG